MFSLVPTQEVKVEVRYEKAGQYQCKQDGRWVMLPKPYTKLVRNLKGKHYIVSLPSTFVELLSLRPFKE